MSPSQLNPAQFMMGIVSNEQGKIGQKIVKAGFSKELQAQSSGLSGRSCFGFALSENVSAQGDPKISNQAAFLGGQVDNAHLDALQKLTPQKRSLLAAQEKIRNNLVFTDGAAIEKIAAQFQLPAETRKEIKSAEDSQGRISLKALEAILNQQNSSAQNILPGQDQAAAQDVQQVFNSISQANPDPAHALPQLSAKPGGSYTLDEFKSALDGVVQQIAKESAGSKQVVQDSSQSAGLSGSNSHNTAGASQSVSPDQVNRLTTDLMPSFGSNNSQGNKSAKDSSIFDASGENKNSAGLASAGNQTQTTAQSETSDSATGAKKAQALDPNGSASPSGKAAFQANQAATYKNSSDGFMSKATAANQAAPASVESQKTAQSASQSGSIASSGKQTSPSASGTKEKQDLHVAPLSDSDFQAESSEKPGNSNQASSNRMAQLGSMDSSLIAGTNEGATAARTTPGQSSSDDRLRSIQSDASLSSDSARITSQSASADTTSQGGGQLREQATFTSFGPGESARQHTAGTTLGIESFQTVSTDIQSAQSGQQASSSPTLSFTNPTWPAQLAQRVQDLQQDKRNQITLELEPKNMGKMTLRIETEHNQVTAWVSTENEHVKTLLTQNAPVLRQHLEDQGLMLGQFNVDVRQEKDNEYSAQDRRSFRKQAKAVSAATGTATSSGEAKSITGRMVYRQEPSQQLISCFA